MTELRNSTPIAMKINPPLPGRWTMHLAWTIRPVPRGEPTLWRSSFGLSARDVVFAPPDSEVCVVRYDVDNDRVGPRLEPLGAHLNVLQPDPLGDNLHFPVFAEAGKQWSVRDVVDMFMAGEFIEELRARL